MAAPVPVYLTVDIVVISRSSGRARILLIQRKNPPFQLQWALPGGFVDPGEDLEAAARRELSEETGISTHHQFIQVGAFGKPDRDPRGRTVSVAFLTEVESEGSQKAGSDAKTAEWFDLESLPGLAFDHADIISKAVSEFQKRPR